MDDMPASGIRLIEDEPDSGPIMVHDASCPHDCSCWRRESRQEHRCGYPDCPGKGR